jgi:hypothetical protein
LFKFSLFDKESQNILNLTPCIPLSFGGWDKERGKKKEGLSPLFAGYSLLTKSASLLRKEGQEGEFCLSQRPS